MVIVCGALPPLRPRSAIWAVPLVRPCHHRLGRRSRQKFGVRHNSIHASHVAHHRIDQYAIGVPAARAEDCRVRARARGLCANGRIGRNFADHAKELNNAVPTEPFFFLKPTSSYIGNGESILVPRGVEAHHEGACTCSEWL